MYGQSIQGMLIKSALVLLKHHRNSPLLAALGIEKVEQLIKRLHHTAPQKITKI